MRIVSLPDKLSEGNTFSMAVEDQGQGRTILLVHAFPFDHRVWEAQIKGLSTRFRVLAPDLRGFGRSTVTPGVVTMEQMADDLAAMLDALAIDEPVVLCGLSMGGYVAFQFVRRHRQRLRGLILCDTRAASDSQEARENRLRTAERVITEGTAFLADQMLPRLCCERTFRHQPEIVTKLRTMILEAPPEGVAAAARGMAQRPDSTPLLGQIDCPTMVVVGQFDTISLPEEMEAMARAIRGASFAVVPDAGHMAPLEQGEHTTQLIAEFASRL
ncbi:MAG TPA: alpha/beta fold hydrolase [Thermogutta sp.]|nr:alpha/beta fold hydrolase [Thermogutta sp.]